MWIWTSSALLASLVVIGLSFPHPDKEYNIPEVGNGERSQYYVLHNDGTFKYGFDGGDGAFESVMSQSLGNRGGNFGYVDPNGNTIKLEYEAGVGGFVARGDHLPKPSPELAEALAAVVRRSNPFVDPLAGTDGDKSYGFKFGSDDYSRNEQADEDGTITGSYNYVDEDGVRRSFTYRAGKGIGFVIEGDSLTQDVSSNQQTHQVANVRSQQHRSSHVAKPRKFQTPSRPSFGTSFRQSTDFSRPAAQVAFTRSETSGDNSYSFNYDADDHSRSETSDRDLNVEGSFSFVSDDGNRRTVNYNAGSGTGFVAAGDHLPVAPEVPDFTNRLSSTRQATSHQVSSSSRRQPTSQSRPVTAHRSTSTSNQRDYNYNAPSSTFSHGVRNQGASSSSTRGASAGVRLSSSLTAPVNKISSAFRTSSSSGTRQTSPFIATSATSEGQQTRGAFEEANIRSSSSPDGAYEFSYDTSSHSRSEAGDSDINVDGKFAFIADDNKEREINYEAGTDTGFIARGAHIPAGPEVPGALSGQPTGDFDHVESVNFVDPLAGSDTDSSYNFDFNSGSYSRSENADEDGNVSGTYTVVDDDGLSITYRFRAGKGIGYEVEEVSRTQGPKPVRPTPYSGDLAFDDEPAFDVPGTANFPTPGQSNYVHPHPISTGSFASTRTRGQGSSSSTSFRGPTSTRGSHSAISSSSGHSGSFKGATRSGGHSSKLASSSHGTGFHGDGTRSTFGQHQTSQTSGVHSLKTKSRPSGSSNFNTLKSSHSEHQFPDFTLHTYDPSPDAEKFGYVLRYN